MTTNQSTIDYLLDQLSGLQSIRARKMFGEYALYCDEKVVALVCDNQLFVKITPEGKALVGERYEEGTAYPGAKPSMLIGAEEIDDSERLSELIRITAANLPAPKPKAKKTAAGSAVTAYIEAAAEPARTRLRKLRALVRKEAPDAVERMAYGLPTWHQGENLLHLGAFAGHVGLYPGPEAIEAFSDKLRSFSTSKGAIKLPHDRDLPVDLVRRIVRWRLEQASGKRPPRVKPDATRKSRPAPGAGKARKRVVKSSSSPKDGPGPEPGTSRAKRAKLLSGGNPQIAKADGEVGAAGSRSARLGPLITGEPGLAAR